MPFEPIFIVYAAVFLVVLLAVEGGFYLLADRSSGGRKINRRLQLLASSGDSQEVLYKLRRAQATGEDSQSTMRRLLGPVRALDELITQAGMTIRTGRMLLVMLAITLCVFAVLLVFFGKAPMRGLLVSVIIGVAFPLIYMIFRRRRRLKKFGEQLPDALDLMVRSLRAGHPISASMGLVSTEMTDPIGTEMGIAVDEMTYGLDLNEALQSMGQRIPVQDLHYLIVAINIQHGTGGNLAEVLGNLSKIIRDRFNMFKRIKALSAEGRLSALVISLLPFCVGGAVWLLNPKYFVEVAPDPLFPIFMGVGATMLLLGLIIMWKMVNFRV
jgi:tight adherence protein B